MATTFHRFPELPPELRLKIWDYAKLHFLRIIEVTDYYPPFRTAEQTAMGDELFTWTARPSAIANSLLSVNREARHEFLSGSHQIFNSTKFDNSSSACYVNFDYDVLYISSTFISMAVEPALISLFGDNLPLVRKNLRFLASSGYNNVKLTLDLDLERRGENSKSHLIEFQKLEELICVISAPREAGKRAGKTAGFIPDRAVNGEDSFMNVAMSRIQERYPNWRCPNVRVARRINEEEFQSLRDAEWWIEKKGDGLPIPVGFKYCKADDTVTKTW